MKHRWSLSVRVRDRLSENEMDSFHKREWMCNAYEGHREKGEVAKSINQNETVLEAK